ncbi:hypothetical protein VOLCADRAFT_87624 [Volvox carteri f. nagariensis]|uniref:F-box domain-containing protein n=1 Tax=Volvox carteri f. nagariensis TaxID=3068 RepID=D8TLT8_VOLCA|nr:uncharacterized protein VOLCADRAFT_87624 [Volvox carteri f. nagariensis]EFJ51521.1 hypothetical protein VOLCADRAFT_87624 [Volvox carteri f. nagariensis]|eukprot:XP_002947473.1 hypothetical protein VOLCADRAFT_87624 [Volvox carteri f. nagariensis]
MKFASRCILAKRASQHAREECEQVSGSEAPVYNILGLPADILEHICHYLNVRDVIALSRTCKLWGGVASSPRVWAGLVQRSFLFEELPQDLEFLSSLDTQHIRAQFWQLTRQRPAFLSDAPRTSEILERTGSRFRKQLRSAIPSALILHLDGRRDFNFTTVFRDVPPGHYYVIWRVMLQPGYVRGYCNFRAVFSRPSDPKAVATAAAAATAAVAGPAKHLCKLPHKSIATAAAVAATAVKHRLLLPLRRKRQDRRRRAQEDGQSGLLAGTDVERAGGMEGVEQEQEIQDDGSGGVRGRKTARALLLRLWPNGAWGCGRLRGGVSSAAVAPMVGRDEDSAATAAAAAMVLMQHRNHQHHQHQHHHLQPGQQELQQPQQQQQPRGQAGQEAHNAPNHLYHRYNNNNNNNDYPEIEPETVAPEGNPQEQLPPPPPPPVRLSTVAAAAAAAAAAAGPTAAAGGPGGGPQAQLLHRAMGHLAAASTKRDAALASGGGGGPRYVSRWMAPLWGSHTNAWRQLDPAGPLGCGDWRSLQMGTLTLRRRADAHLHGVMVQLRPADGAQMAAALPSGETRWRGLLVDYVELVGVHWGRGALL